MNNAAGWTVTVKLEDGTLRDVYSKKRDRDQAHADVLAHCRNATLVTSVKI